MKRSKSGSTLPVVQLAAFGKHPGWNDHIDDIGMDTDALLEVKRVLYIEGLVSNIDSGTWEPGEDGEKPNALESFGHIFLWHLPGRGFVIGRMWSSSDGKGRTRYPMILCVHVRGLSLDWARRSVLPVLERLEDECKGVTTAAEVHALLSRAEGSLQSDAAAESLTELEIRPSSRMLASLADQIEMGESREGLYRLLYQIEREFGAYVRPTENDSRMATRTLDARPQHLRVPWCAPSAGEAMVNWAGFFASTLDDAAPFVMFIPLEEGWVDLIAGTPGTSQQACIRQLPEILPYTTDIPYTIDEAFIKRADERVEASRSGTTPNASQASKTPRPRDRQRPSGKSGKKLSPAVLLAGTGVVLVLVALVLWLVVPMLGGGTENGEDPSRDEEVVEGDLVEWEELCAAWPAHKAFVEAVSQPGSDGDARTERYAEHEGLTTVMETVEATERSIDPREIAARPGESVEALVADPPRAVRTASGRRSTSQALAMIRDMRTSLKQWPWLLELKSAASTFEANGWTGPTEEIATRIKALEERLSDDADGAQLARAIDRLLDLRESGDVQKLREASASLDQMRERFAEADAVNQQLGLTEMIDAAVSASAGSSTADLATTIETTSAKLAEIDAFFRGPWHESVRQDALLAHPPPIEFEGEPTQDDLRRWVRLAESSRYQKLDPAEDPRRALARRERQMKGLLGTEAAMAGTASIEPLQQEFESVSRGVNELSSRTDLDWNTGNQQQIRDLVSPLLDRLDVMWDTLAARDESRRGDVQATIVGFERIDRISDSEALNEAWRDARDTLTGDSSHSDEVLARSLRNAYSWLLQIDASLMPTLGTDAQLESSPVVDALADVYQRLREETIRELTAAHPLGDDDSTQVLIEVAEDLESTRSDALAFASDLDQLNRHLQLGYALTDPSGPAFPATTIVDSLTESPFHEDASVAEACAPTLARIASLETIENADQVELLAWSLGQHEGGLAEAMAAWMRLGGEFPWPASPEDLQQDLVILERIGELFASVPDDNRRESLRADLATRSHKDWSQCLHRVSDTSAVDRIHEMRSDFAISDDALSPEDQFDEILYQVRSMRTQVQSEAEDADRVKAFLESKAADIATLEVQLEGDTREFAAAIRTQLIELASGEIELGAAVDPAQFGPGTQGWEWTLDDTTGDITYYRPSRDRPHVTLEFVRVGSGGGWTGDPFYIGRNEISVGDFDGILQQASERGTLSELLVSFNPLQEDPRSGPRAWTWRQFGLDSQAITPGGGWQSRGTRPDIADEYAAGQVPPKPTRDSPMQHAPVAAMVFVANITGCRLPTRDEWLQALSQSMPDQSTISPGTNTNLRDAKWKQQNDYVVNAPRRFPDPAAGSAWSADDDASWNGDDGVLWFSDVITGDDPIRHLVGNVAEVVLESDPPQTLATTPAAATQAVRDDASRFHVAGGSALSPPSVDPFTTRAIDVDPESKLGWSDVGFRLAFAAPDTVGPRDGVVAQFRLFAARLTYPR